MALSLFYQDEDDVYVEVSSGNEFTTPITTTHDGKNGDIKTMCIYLKNDDLSLWYSNIIVTPVDLVGDSTTEDTSYEETGWGIKLSKGGTSPTSAEWNDIDWGDSISMDNIGAESAGDDSTYSPFWYLISCPPNTDAQNKSDIVLRVSYTENAV
jgi:hypothetical protein